MSASLAFPVSHAVPTPGRKAVVVGSVVLMHALGLWALNQGLLRPPAELIVPAQILVELIAAPVSPPAATPAPAPVPRTPTAEPPAPKAPTPRLRATPAPAPKPRPAPRPAPAPAPLAVSDTAPSLTEATPAATSAAPALASASTSASSTNAPTASPAPAAVAPPSPAPMAVVQPSSSAAYLNNAAPPYPAMSRRLGETGRVVVRVLIGPDGRAQDARIQRSSGFDRLDQVALETARDRWRYVPGTRGGVAEAMWFNVPINFVLE